MAAYFSSDAKFGGSGLMLEDVALAIVDAKGLTADFPLVFPAASAWESFARPAPNRVGNRNLSPSSTR